jgi:hypothetical protein
LFELKGWIFQNSLSSGADKLFKSKRGEGVKEQFEKRFTTAGSQNLIQGGHGAGAGVAVAQVTQNVFLGQRPQLGGEDFRKELNARFSDLQNTSRVYSPAEIEQVNIKGVHNYFTSAGKFEENFITLVSFQSSRGNRTDSALERAQLTYLRKWIEKNFTAPYDPNTKYSPSLADRVSAVITWQIAKNLKNASIKKGYAAPVVKGSETVQRTTKKRGQSRIVAEKASGLSVKAAQRKKERGTAAVGALDLLAYINARINTKVKSNMEAPRLVNRSGRFASSVIATDVQMTPQGYPSVGYTYDKEPYQVFEVGVGTRPWATPDRDPRALIDKSIREIAAELFISKLYTRRI